MSREIIRCEDAPAPFAGFSQGVKANGFVFVSGQGPFDPVTGDVVGETIEEQTRQCLTNVAAILRAAGASIDDVVSTTIILAEEDDFAGLNDEWVRWFPENPPARQGAKLPVRPKGIRVSVAAVAAV